MRTSRRKRVVHEKVRSTTHWRGKSTKPRLAAAGLIVSRSIPGYPAAAAVFSLVWP